MTYGILLWGWSTDCERYPFTNEEKRKIEKRAIRVLVKAKYRDFMRLQILTSKSVYIIFEILKYVKKNIGQCKVRAVNSNWRVVRN